MTDIGLRRGTVALEPHDPAWEAAAAQTVDRLKRILPNTADIQHIGSTAVRNIRAKPLIDIAIGLSDLEEIRAWNDVLEENGFIFRGRDHPGQYLYVCGEQDIRTHHIHAVVYGSEAWNDYIGLRDYLNCHEDDAQAYSALKESLAEQYPNDRETYTAMKSGLIRELLAKAHTWRKDQFITDQKDTPGAVH